jgi:hypothetical protein
MSSEEANQNNQQAQKANEEIDINLNEQNNIILDLYDEDTLNISLEEEKPLFTKLYSKITEKISSVVPESEQNNDFLSNFENFFKNQIEIINSSVKNNEPNFIYATNVLVAKIKVLNFFNTKYLEDFLSKSDSESANILNLISDNLTKATNNVIEIIKKLEQRGNEINALIEGMQNKLNQNELYIKQLNDKYKILNEKFNKLKDEDELITQKLINNKNLNKYNNNSNILENANFENKNPNINSLSVPQLKIKSFKSLNNDEENSKKLESISNQTFKNSIYIKDKIPNPLTHNNINNNVELTNLSLAGNRVFTLKMMKEIISNMYTTKIAFDKKCVINKQPKQTMEEYMYIYLNQKYGLKNMVIEWATNIINGIRTFSSEDTEISLFGKILQNELEESCHLLINNLKENINTILISILKSENPYKDEYEINIMKNKLIKGEIPPEKTQQIIENLFDEKGRGVLFEKINTQINNKRTLMMKNNSIKGKYTREEMNKIIYNKQNECNFVQYDFLLDICLEYQIKLHIKYLKPFVKLFQSIDTNRDGILDEEQFVHLIKNMNIFEEQNIVQIVEEFLNNLDPYGYKRVTFSEIVELFTKINFDQNQSILDKFCSDKNNNIIESKKNSNNNSAKKTRNSGSKKKYKKFNEDIIVK